ncbi:nitrogenase-stabilizing/protective protein NifW [Agarivorans aestuarii]|uniref:Nitrogenase-stabilizing/protective protein NifW n=1 Tax=Agarivorans aestuarii TaxID=1563703 RepID=A0ABU7G1F1_9ALTE|nr:nitrogenase-stabilizing/protective protein NifW [Agarivorans aestuarii]MEE1673233.1 nitrogenase-stabilizing/protective protein NifW [Agarivorans aestuarii]
MQANPIAKQSEEDLDISELASAEDFLNHFGVNYQASLVRVKRVLFMRLLNQVLAKQGSNSFSDYQAAVSKAYCLLEKGVVLAHQVPNCEACEGCE